MTRKGFFVILSYMQTAEKAASAFKKNLNPVSLNPVRVKKRALVLLLEVGLEHLASSVEKAKDD